jgi:hypothetical protein
MTTDERLEKLERELSRAKTRFRWLVVGAALCFMSVAVIYAYGQYRTAFLPRAPRATEASKEIRANSFVLEDANGQPRASLGMDEDGLELRLKYANGNIGAALCLHDDKMVLSLSDNNGKPRAVLGVIHNVPLLCLYDEKEEPRATLAVTADGPHLVLRDEKGNPLPIR